MRRVQRMPRGQHALRIRGHVVDFYRVIPRAGDDRVGAGGGRRGATTTCRRQRRPRDDAQHVRLGARGEPGDGSESPQIPNAHGGARSGVKQRRGGRGRGDRDGIDERLAVRHDVGTIGRRERRMSLVNQTGRVESFDTSLSSVCEYWKRKDIS